MTEKRIRCDYCGASPALEIRYDFERVRDAAGGVDSEYKTVDLCFVHIADRLQSFLQEPPKAPAEAGKVAFSQFANSCTWKPA